MSDKVSPREDEGEQKSTEEKTSVQQTDKPETKTDVKKASEKTDGESKSEREKASPTKPVFTVPKYATEKTSGDEKMLPFTTVETMCLLDTYRKYADVLSTTTNKAVKQKIWTRILNSVNAVVSGEKNRTLSEVKRKWRSLLHQAREDFRKFKNATDENEEYPEIGIYSETIWDICGSQLDLSDDSDFNKRLTQSSDEEGDALWHRGTFRQNESTKRKEKHLHYKVDTPSGGGYNESISDEEAMIIQPKKRSRKEVHPYQSYPEMQIAAAGESDSEDFEEIADDAELFEVQMSLMKSKLRKHEREKKKLIKEIEKLDVEKEKLLLKRQKIELEIVVLRERLKSE